MVALPVQTFLAQFIYLTRISLERGRVRRNINSYIGIVMNHKLQQSPIRPSIDNRRRQSNSIRWSGSHTGQVPTHEHFQRSSEHHYGCSPTCSSKDDLRLWCWHIWSRGAVEAHRHIVNVIHVHTRCIR